VNVLKVHNGFGGFGNRFGRFGNRFGGVRYNFAKTGKLPGIFRVTDEFLDLKCMSLLFISKECGFRLYFGHCEKFLQHDPDERDRHSRSASSVPQEMSIPSGVTQHESVVTI
jgi:hypothetical protein